MNVLWIFGGRRGVDIRNCKCEHHVWVTYYAQMQDSYIGDYLSVGRYNKIRGADIGKYCSIS